MQGFAPLRGNLPHLCLLFLCVTGSMQSSSALIQVNGENASRDTVLPLFATGKFTVFCAQILTFHLSPIFQDRIVYYKHTDANFYSAWPFVFGRTISQMPQASFYIPIIVSLLRLCVSLYSHFRFLVRTSADNRRHCDIRNSTLLHDRTCR